MEKINIDKKKLSKIKEIELKQDLIVPDTKQDIVSILDGNFYCYFSKVEILNERIKVNGNVDAYISYISVGEDTVGLKTIFGFEDAWEDNTIDEKMNLQYHIEILKQDIKIVNERKISISLVLKIEYDAYGIDEITIFDNFEEIEDIQLNSQKTNMNSIIGISSNMASMKEEIKVENHDMISDILKLDTSILNKEVKISYHKVLTKADLKVHIIYLTKDGRVGKVEEKFPIMSFMDIENVKEDHICSTDYQMRNSVINLNYGEENAISVQMEYEIICKVFETKEQEIVNDLYSLKYQTEFVSKEVEVLDELSPQQEENVDIEEKIELDNVKNVIDVFGKSKILSHNEGELELKVYYEREDKMGLNVKNIQIPFMYRTNADSLFSEPKNLEFDLNEHVLMIKAKISVKEANPPKRMLHIVQDVTKKEALNEKEDSMIIYSVKKEDTLWNISKKFKVKEESIIHSNDLEEPYSLRPGEKMYIIR